MHVPAAHAREGGVDGRLAQGVNARTHFAPIVDLFHEVGMLLDAWDTERVWQCADRHDELVVLECERWDGGHGRNGCKRLHVDSPSLRVHRARLAQDEAYIFASGKGPDGFHDGAVLEGANGGAAQKGSKEHVVAHAHHGHRVSGAVNIPDEPKPGPAGTKHDDFGAQHSRHGRDRNVFGSGGWREVVG
jgi:hypothetical protein